MRRDYQLHAIRRYDMLVRDGMRRGRNAYTYLVDEFADGAGCGVLELVEVFPKKYDASGYVL